MVPQSTNVLWIRYSWPSARPIATERERCSPNMSRQLSLRPASCRTVRWNTMKMELKTSRTTTLPICTSNQERGKVNIKNGVKRSKRKQFVYNHVFARFSHYHRGITEAFTPCGSLESGWPRSLETPIPFARTRTFLVIASPCPRAIGRGDGRASA